MSNKSNRNARKSTNSSKTITNITKENTVIIDTNNTNTNQEETTMDTNTTRIPRRFFITAVPVVIGSSVKDGAKVVGSKARIAGRTVIDTTPRDIAHGTKSVVTLPKAKLSERKANKQAKVVAELELKAQAMANSAG